MKNTFFKIALAQASRLAGKPGRMLHLVGQLIQRLYKMDRTQLWSIEFRERFLTLGRLVSSYAHGRYRIIPTKTLLTIVAALLYFLNPFDLVPDAILGVGLMDDLAVLTWVYRATQLELTKFLEWEKAELAVIAS